MKKTLLWITVISCSVVAGFYFHLSLAYWETQHTSEDIISREIAFLEKHKSSIPCAELVDQSDGVYVEELKDVVIVWKMSSLKAPVSKLVVDHSLFIAQESLANDCSKSDA